VYPAASNLTAIHLVVEKPKPLTPAVVSAPSAPKVPLEVVAPDGVDIVISQKRLTGTELVFLIVQFTALVVGNPGVAKTTGADKISLH
jgi:hypothetical protein